MPIRLSAQNTQRAPTIRVEVDSVFVPVVVRDAKGHTANDLTKDDFQVFDNGKAISDFGFATEKRAEFYSATAAETPNPVPDVANPPAVAHTAPVPTRFIVFVFDDLHLGVAELARVQKASSRIFAET